MHSIAKLATTPISHALRPFSNARRALSLRVLTLVLVIMTALHQQQHIGAAAAGAGTRTRTLDPWIECLRANNGTFQYIPKQQFDVPQGFKDPLIPAFQGSLFACGTNVMSHLFLKMMVNRTGTPEGQPAKRHPDGVIVQDLQPGDYVLSVDAFLTRTPEEARQLRDASTSNQPLPKVPLVPLGRPPIMQPFRILAVTPNLVPATTTLARVSTLVTAPMTISFGAQVSNPGPYKANWTCCATGDVQGPCGGQCPQHLRNKLGSNSSNIAFELPDPSQLPVGLFRVLLRFGPANLTFVISVENIKVVPIELFQNFDSGKDAYMVFAKTAAQATVQWKLGNADRQPADNTGRSLRIPRADLSTTGPSEVSCKATLPDGTTSTVKLELAKVLAPTVTCVAQNAERPGDNHVTALNGLVRVRAMVQGVPADASVTYNFGFGRAPASAATVADNAVPVFVTPAPILTNEFNVTAPPVPVASANNNFQVPFFVDIVVNGQIKLRAACPLPVNPPVFGSPAEADAQVKQQRDAFAQAANSGDNSAMITAAANAMGLALVQGSAKTNETERRQLETNLAGNMATALRRTFGTDAKGQRTADMSAELKVNALDCLSQMSLAPLKAGVPPPADCNASCVAQLRQDVLDVVATAIAPGTDGTRIDMKTYGSKVLDVLSGVAPGHDSAKAARSAAVALASQMSVGETVSVASTDGKTKCAGTTIPATLVQDLTSSEYNKLDSATGGAAMSFPAGIMLPGAGAGSIVSLAATTFTTTPFTTSNGLPANYGASSSTTDFSVALDGEAQTITNLGLPIKGELTRTANTPNVQTIVRYYDETTGAWSSAGITDVAVDATTGRITFKTNHLTAFATFDSAADPTTTTAPPATTSAAAGPTTAGAPATTSIPMGAAFSHAVVAAVLCGAAALLTVA